MLQKCVMLYTTRLLHKRRLNLFLFRCIGIPVRTIEGYGKDDSNIEEVAFDLQSSDINHAWNVVHIGDEWRFVDCTWDAGYIDDTGKFQWLCNDFYFLTNPDFFGVKHFPYINEELETSKQWQLVEEPLDLETFSRRAILHEYAMENGIGLVTHGDTLIEVISETTVIISGPGIPIEDVSCEMEEIYQFDNVIQDQYTMAERMGHDGVKIKLRLPSIATYILRIYAKMFSKDNEFGKVATYIVKCLQVSKDMELFPSHGIWGPELYYQDIGFEKAIVYQWWYEASCGEIDLYVPVWQAMEIVPRLQSSEDVEEVVNSVLIQTDSRSIVAIARMPKKGNYKLTISKKMPDGSVIPAIHYLITCKHGYVPFMPFPIAFPVVQQFMITLVEPKKRFLPARSYVRFRIISPLLQSLRLGEQTFSKRVGDKWDFTILTPGPDEDLMLYGGTADFRTSILCFRTVLFIPEPHVCERLIRTSQSRRSLLNN